MPEQRRQQTTALPLVLPVVVLLVVWRPWSDGDDEPRRARGARPKSEWGAVHRPSF